MKGVPQSQKGELSRNWMPLRALEAHLALPQALSAKKRGGPWLCSPGPAGPHLSSGVSCSAFSLALSARISSQITS